LFFLTLSLQLIHLTEVTGATERRTHHSKVDAQQTPPSAESMASIPVLRSTQNNNKACFSTMTAYQPR
jgi:hypothetical protein